MPFDSSNTYVTVEQVRRRLSTYGLDWSVDVNDADGYRDTAETLYCEEAIEYANNLIDEAICQSVDISPRPSNPWLTDRGVDIVAARVVSLGGRKIPKPLQDAADSAEAKLALVRDAEMKVPGLDYTQVLDSGKRAGFPILAVNVCSRARRP